MNILAKLFHSESSELSPTDGLSQVEREAIIDLLLFGIYMDNHLSFTEDNVLRKKVELLDWKSNTTVDLYISNATSKVRQAITEQGLQVEFLKSLAARITTEKGKQKAINSLTELFNSDGEDPREYAFREAVAHALK